MEQECVIACTNGQSHGGDVLWWKPSACGYTDNLDRAGRFPEGYDCGDDVMIPVDRAMEMSRVVRLVGWPGLERLREIASAPAAGETK